MIPILHQTAKPGYARKNLGDAERERNRSAGASTQVLLARFLLESIDLLRLKIEALSSVCVDHLLVRSLREAEVPVFNICEGYHI